MEELLNEFRNQPAQPNEVEINPLSPSDAIRRANDRISSSILNTGSADEAIQQFGNAVNSTIIDVTEGNRLLNEVQTQNVATQIEAENPVIPESQLSTIAPADLPINAETILNPGESAISTPEPIADDTAGIIPQETVGAQSQSSALQDFINETQKSATETTNENTGQEQAGLLNAVQQAPEIRQDQANTANLESGSQEPTINEPAQDANTALQTETTILDNANIPVQRSKAPTIEQAQTTDNPERLQVQQQEVAAPTTQAAPSIPEVGNQASQSEQQPASPDLPPLGNLTPEQSKYVYDNLTKPIGQTRAYLQLPIKEVTKLQQQAQENIANVQSKTKIPLNDTATNTAGNATEVGAGQTGQAVSGAAEAVGISKDADSIVKDILSDSTNSAALRKVAGLIQTRTR
jgi:hypothetical protein